MRKKEYERQQAILRQQQLARDYLLTHCKIARKNPSLNYPLTEKILTGSPEDLKALLTADFADLEVDPADYPEGLVIPHGEGFFDASF